MSYAVMVRSHEDDEERYVGPFRSHARAKKLADSLRAFVDAREAAVEATFGPGEVGSAYAYVVELAPPRSVTKKELVEWMFA